MGNIIPSSRTAYLSLFTLSRLSRTGLHLQILFAFVGREERVTRVLAIGLVFFPGPIIPVIEDAFPKLFLTADANPSGYADSLQRVYEQSAGPKTYKSNTSDRNSPMLFTDPCVGLQVLADLTDFIHAVVQER